MLFNENMTSPYLRCGKRPETGNSEGLGQLMIAVFSSIIMLVTLTRAQQGFIPTITPMAFYSNVTAATCVSDSDCGINRFCSRPPLSNLKGSCLQCWRCSLFSDIYGVCPDGCYSSVGSACVYPTDCGQGLFCSIDTTGLGNPTCRSCELCRSDSDELYGNCTLSCPSGPLDASGYMNSINSYIFLSFSAAEISSTYNQGVIQPGDLSLWFNSSNIPSSQSQIALEAFWNSEDGITDTAAPLPVHDYVNTLIDQTSLSVICPVIPSDGSQALAVVFPGCPCNASKNAASFQCPAGYRCSPSAYHGLSTEVIMQPALGRLQAICIACVSGQYCAQGTYLTNEKDLSSLDCPVGKYCPSPGEQYTCPAGAYCVARTTTPMTCDYSHLLSSSPYTYLPTEPVTVIKRLRDNGDPLKGNLCPAGSTKPNSLCMGGFYCPNVTTSIICPAGHFCKQQSISPRPCNILTSCPMGTETPQYSGMAFLSAALIIVAMPLLWFLHTWLDNSVSASYEEVLKTELKRTRTIKIQKHLFQGFKSMSNPSGFEDTALTAKFPGFGMVEPRIELEFQNLGMRLHKQTKVVLHGVSGYFPSGKLNAVMGPSGSGKTTFLNVLCGKVGGECVITGAVRVNDEHISLAKLRKIMGFVPQDDIVHVDLTVRENLAYAACLRLPLEANNKQRRALVIEDALEMLQLKAIQHYRVGSVEKRGISGGQRKRVNIGLELVAQPSILFLDEPTSGLDSTASSDILGSLADMTSLGMTVIAVLHQPRYSSFNLFDQVLLLGHGGQTVYMGPPGIAVVYFRLALNFTIPKNENPADMLMDIIGGKLARDNDPRFKPTSLAKWWAGKGPAWVAEFERCNPLMKAEDLMLDPETLQDIDEAFDKVDNKSTGRINADQLLDLFEKLGLPISVNDAVLLIRKINGVAGSRPGSAGTGSLVQPCSFSKSLASPSATSLDNTTPAPSRPASARPAASSRDASASEGTNGIASRGLKPSSTSSNGARSRAPSNDSHSIRGSLSGLGQRLGTLISRRFGSRQLGSQLGHVPEGAEQGQEMSHADLLAGGLTITKQQLMEALEKTYDKKLADANADPMERFADPQMQYNIPAVRVVSESHVTEIFEGSESCDEGSIMDDDSANGSSVSSPQMRSRVSATLSGPGLYGGNMTAGPQMDPRDSAAVSGAAWTTGGPLGEGTNSAGVPLGVPSGVFARDRHVINALINAQIDMPHLPRPSSPATAWQTANSPQHQPNGPPDGLLREISTHLDRAASVEPGRPWHAGRPDAASPRDPSSGSPMMASAFPLPSSPRMHRHLVIPASPPSKHSSVLKPSPSRCLFGTSHSNPLASLEGDNDQGGNSALHHFGPLDPNTQQKATLDQSFSEENYGIGWKSFGAGHDVDGDQNFYDGQKYATGTLHHPCHGQPLGEACEAEAQPSNSDGGAHCLLSAEHSYVSDFGRPDTAASAGGALPGPHPQPAELTGSGGGADGSLPGHNSHSPRGMRPLSGTTKKAGPRVPGGVADVGSPMRLAGGVSKSTRLVSFSSPGSRVRGKPHTRETVWAEGLLAGMLHQSITARRGNVLRRRASASGGYSNGGAVTGAHASATAMGREGSEWDQQAGRHASILDLNSKSKTKLALDAWNWETSPLEEQIANRRFPHITRQLWTLLQRGVTKYCRAFWPLRVIDSLLLLVSAFIIGLIQSTNWGLTAVPSNVVMAMTCLGVLSTVTHLRTFSQDRVLLWRETTSGVSIGAFFMSQNIIEFCWVLISPALMLGPYYFLTLPRLPFSTLYVLAMNVCWWTSGMAYLISALVPAQAVLMSGVFVALIFGAFLQGLSPTIASVRGTWMEYLLGLGYNRWAMEIMTINELDFYQDNMRNSIIMIFKGIGLCGMDKLLVVGGGGDSLTPDEAISFLHIQKDFSFSACNKYIINAHIALIALGSAFRLLAFFLLYFARKTQY